MKNQKYNGSSIQYKKKKCNFNLGLRLMYAIFGEVEKKNFFICSDNLFHRLN